MQKQQRRPAFLLESPAEFFPILIQNAQKGKCGCLFSCARILPQFVQLLNPYAIITKIRPFNKGFFSLNG